MEILNVPLKITVIALAVSDEVHQIFIPGRTAKVLDTFIDGAGSLVGITIYSIYQSKCRKMSYFDEQ